MDSEALLIQTLEVSVTTNYAFVASATLWIADYIATLHTELRMIWFKKQSGTSILFIFNRICFLGYLLTYSVFTLPGNGSDKGCDIIRWFQEVFQSTATVTTTTLFALRIYAIYGKSRMILMVTTLFILSRFLLDMLSTVFQQNISAIGSPVQGFTRCAVVFQNENNFYHYQRLQIGLTFLALAFDAFIFGATLRKTFHYAIASKRLGGFSIIQRILYDGLIYFLIMLIVGIISTIDELLIFFDEPSDKSTFLDLIIPFFNVLPNILISRLMLSLRTFTSPEEMFKAPKTAPGQHFSGIHFATNTFLGNIGAPLDGEIWEEKNNTEE
ncbi:hypothetical protein GYMLUDRAFT_49336 [Collybiopsis luxurians FD-317 M1]|uniref:DUF6533 domain-containing protein n=1 Tax=Collybiopsis luxurians FD-317 M1 TaxID=944289 RepID=A0A0D0CEA7_9AGAR|nr:hypothetical protein GYMLUDRAFT_49336 [Collybiopsis luxurians FD-317 M1]